MKSILIPGVITALLSLSISVAAETYPFQGPLYEVAVGPYMTGMWVTGGIGSNAMDLSIGQKPDPTLFAPFTLTGTFMVSNAPCTNNVYNDASNFASAVDGLQFVGLQPTTPLPILSPFGLLLLAGGVIAVGAVAMRHRIRA